MIASRRKAHVLLMLGLAVVLPGVVGGGLLARAQVPPDATVPEVLAPARAKAKDGLLLGTGVRFQVHVDASSRTITLSPLENLLVPDVLVYWQRTSETKEQTRPVPGAKLVGKMAGREARRFQLPAAASGKGESLVFYSLAQHRVVATLQLGAFASQLASKGQP